MAHAFPDLGQGIAALVAPERLQSLSATTPVIDLSQLERSPNVSLPGSIVLIDIAQRDADALLEAYSVRRADVAMIVIGDDLNAGLVRTLLRFKVSDVIAGWSDVADIAATIATLAARLDPQATEVQPTSTATCWAFQGAVGGAGATTLAIETAFALAQRENETVCLIDLNFTGGMAASFLDGTSKLDLDGIAANPERLDSTLLRVFCWQHDRDVSLIAAPRNRRADEIATEEAVLGLLEVACSVFPRVVLDMPRHRLPWTDTVLAAVNEVVVVSELTVPSLHAGADLARDIDMLRPNSPPARLVLNRMFTKRSQRASFPIDKAEQAIHRRIDHMIRSDWEAARLAVNMGMPVVLSKPKSPMVEDVTNMLDRLLKLDEVQPGRRKAGGR